VPALVREQSGQGTVEYVLLLSMIITLTLGIAKGTRSILDQGILKLGAQLEKDLKTGRAPLSVWEN